MKKFKNKYRIESFRLKSWDYRNDGSYFITIKTEDKKHFFGKIKDKIMHSNEIGELAEKFWMEIPEHFPFIELGSFVVMPNHTHGILIIENGTSHDKLQSENDLQSHKTSDIKKRMSEISPKAGSISTIIRSYKSVVSKHARKINPSFGWQAKFHDHIIRNSRSFERIQNYIVDNPENWDEDSLR